ncbi:MAG: M20/M25/M40 family metallo-hydrolase [Chloroflexota bacterium]
MALNEHPALHFLQQLVRTESLSGQEESAARLVEQTWRQLGFEEVHTDRLGNVLARRGGRRPGLRVLLDAHLDVVPATSPAEWRFPPFSGELAEGRVWGRGAADTKASLAAMTTALASLPADALNGEVYLSASVGEEVLEGAAFSAVLDAVQPDVVIIGEPSDCRLGIAQRGRARLAFTVHGKAAHSSAPEAGQNAIENAANLIQRIAGLPLPTHPLLGQGLMTAIQMQSQPYPSLSTTPYRCEVIYDRRLMPGETIDGLMAEYTRLLSDLNNWQVIIPTEGFVTWTGVELRQPDFHPAWALEPHSAWVTQAVEALRSAGLPGETFAVPYCTNGSASGGERGIPTLVFGPGSIHQAHRVDESIEVEEVLRGERGYRALLSKLGKMG